MTHAEQLVACGNLEVDPLCPPLVNKKKPWGFNSVTYRIFFLNFSAQTPFQKKEKIMAFPPKHKGGGGLALEFMIFSLSLRLSSRVVRTNHCERT